MTHLLLQYMFSSLLYTAEFDRYWTTRK